MQNIVRIILLTGISALILASVGCKRQEGPRSHQTPEVSVLAVQSESIRITTELPGRTSPFLIAEIRPQVSGLVRKRLFEEGSVVDAGQVLYQIDPAPFHAALDSAEASLARAEAGLHAIRLRVERYRELLNDKAVSRQSYDDALANMKQAEAEVQASSAAVETARINLGYTKVKAPISGRIGKSTVTDGAIVTAYQPIALATIQQLDPIYVDVPQSATELLELRRRLEAGHLQRDESDQNKVRLILSNGTEYELEGTLKFQDVSVELTTGSVILRAVFPNPDGVLLPGMFVRAVIFEGVDKAAIMIPQQCIGRTPKGEPFALVVDAEKNVSQRMLTIDRAVGNKWLVSSGLNPGDTIIVEGRQKAGPGNKVNTVPFDSGKDAAEAETEKGKQSSPAN